MDNRDFIKVGRGHDSEVRITDISVSRCHALIKRGLKGEYIVEDNNSKFGTLVLVRKPYMLLKNTTNYIQLGRSIIEASIKDPDSYCSLRNLCQKSKSRVPKGMLAFDGEDFFPEEFLKKEHEHTREDEATSKSKKKKKRDAKKSNSRHNTHSNNHNNNNRGRENLLLNESFSPRRAENALENMTEQL